MLGQPHIIDVGFIRVAVRQLYRLFPKDKLVYTRCALCNGKETLPVAALHTGNQTNLSIQFNCSSVEHRIDAQPFHEIRVGFRIQVIPPVQRHVFSGQYRILPAVIDSIIEIGLFILSVQQSLLLPQLLFISFLHHIPFLRINSKHILPLW